MKSLRILCWNVNGIRAVLKKGFLEWMKKESPDILCLQETKASEDQLPKELFKGYHSSWCSGEKKGYSGVLTLSKEKPLSVKTGFGVKKFDCEGRILITEFPSFILFNIYFPNGKQSPERLKYKMEFYEAFLNYVEKLKKEGKKIIICGDVNTAHKEIDLARPKENENISGFLPIERAWMDTFVSHSFIDTFRIFHKEANQYTWWSVRSGARKRNVGWRIDYFFVSENMLKEVVDAFILPEVQGSDHCPLGLMLKV